MFSNLLRLYQKNTKKLPVEDFTTELLAGVLKNDVDLKRKFCSELLELDSRNFRVKSQKRYRLDAFPDCIIDIVIEGDKEICFIENKVNSLEGLQQLERYSLVLDRLNDNGWKTKLVYCTKNIDPKKRKKHAFKQIRWYDISQFFKLNSEGILSKLFVQYLNENGMSEEMVFYSKDFITIENYSRVHNIMYQNIEHVKKEFIKKFGDFGIQDHRHTLKSQILEHERVCIMKTPIFEAQGYSELLYGFELTGKLVVQIYLSNENEYYSSILKEVKVYPYFNFEDSEHGLRVFIYENLGIFLNDLNSENKIKSWFIEKFGLVDNFKNNTKDFIKWVS